jgi:hypothetical protein
VLGDSGNDSVVERRLRRQHRRGRHSCGKVQPCGGDPVGTWNITESCIDAAAAGEELIKALTSVSGCTTAKLQSTHVKQTGSATFNADMTYSAMSTGMFDATVLVPASCLTLGGFPLTCEQLNLLSSQLMLNQIGSFTCSKASDGCTCKVVGSPQESQESGTYVVSGTHMERTSNTSPGGGNEFCVKGNSLHLITLDEMTPGSTKILSDVVSRRQ